MNKILIVLLGMFTTIQISYAQVEHTSGGVGSAYTLDYPSNIPALTAGLSFTFKASHSSIGATTININSTGAVPIKKEVSQDLVADDILSGQVVTIVYDGTNFQMTSKSGTSGGVGSRIQDGDNNTFVETGASDRIDFELGGTPHFRMTGSRLEFLNSNTSVFIGDAAGQLAGAQSVAVGWLALTGNAGTSNTAIGYQSQRIATGVNNTALGFASGYSFTGSSNTAIGYQALNTTTSGFYNTALGYNSGQTNLTGSNNIFIGRDADAGSGALGNAIAIGSLAQVDASNSMVLGSINGVNGATANTKVGIGTTIPTASLDVVGTLRYSDGNESVGNILVSDADGLGTWKMNAVAFDAGVNTGPPLNWSPNLSNSGDIVMFNSEQIDEGIPGGSFTSSIFTAPESGLYSFDVSLMVEFNGSGDLAAMVGLMKNGGSTPLKKVRVIGKDNIESSVSLSCIVRLAKNDQIEVRAISVDSSDSLIISSDEEGSWFSGHLIYAD